MTTARTRLYAGLDIGTSGARAVAIDANGKVHANARSRMDEHSSDHRDPYTWWAAAQSALTQLCQQINANARASDSVGGHAQGGANGRATEITALAVDATSGTLLAVNRDGAPVAGALMYNDPINDPTILNAISAVAPQQSAVHGASSGLARAISLQNAPGCVHLLHQADWIVGCLSGSYSVSDESNALKTGYDPILREWPAWLSATGIDLHKLPAVVPAGTVTGSIKASTAQQLGLPATLQIIAGATDGCASFLATGARDSGDCVTALGSTMTMKMLCERPIFSPRYGIYSHRIGDQWLAGGASNSGGAVLEHFFSSVELQKLSLSMRPSTDSGLNYYPLLKPGERFPHNDANWPPAIKPRPASDSHFLQGLLEGMANIEYTGYQRLGELGAPKPRSVRSVGSGADNLQWQAIRQRIHAVPFRSSLSTEAATGAARLALQAMCEEGV